VCGSSRKTSVVLWDFKQNFLQLIDFSKKQTPNIKFREILPEEPR
jgi:hypothetical protein